MIIAPDASVLLKWVLPDDDERGTEAALALRDEAANGAIELVVPQLWVYEVRNTLARRFPAHANGLLASLIDFRLTEARLDAKWRRRAISLAVTYNVAFYDAAYHAVALALDGVFATADERYVRSASRAGQVSSTAPVADSPMTPVPRLSNPCPAGATCTPWRVLESATGTRK